MSLDDDFNVNNSVWVRLTDEGWRIRWEEFTRWAPHSNYHLFPERTDDWQHFQLWELMQVFGPHIYHGMPTGPFVGNVIRFTEPKAAAA